MIIHCRIERLDNHIGFLKRATNMPINSTAVTGREMAVFH